MSTDPVHNSEPSNSDPSDSPWMKVASIGWCLLGGGIIVHMLYGERPADALIDPEALNATYWLSWALYIAGLWLAALGHGKVLQQAEAEQARGGPPPPSPQRTFARLINVAAFAYSFVLLTILGWLALG